MTKQKRQDLILKLIQENEIQTQDELLGFLQDAGVEVTQATISRDINELKLRKVHGKSKPVCYAPPGTVETRFAKILKEAYISADKAGNIVVIHTMSGMAMAMASVIDVMDISDVVGCIAGDDTVFCAVKYAEDAERVIRCIEAVAHM